MSSIKVKISTLPGTVQSELKRGLKIITDFKAINKIEFDLLVCLDYKLDCPGLFIDDLPDRIYVNPLKCQKLKVANRKRCVSGYVDSYDIYDVLIHEFSHFLDLKYDILKKYIATFGKRRCKINANCNTSFMEEIAELLNIFIVNPMLLKIIDKERWAFFKGIFKSPTPTSKSRFIEFWKSWSKDIKEKCRRDFSIHVSRGRIYSPCGSF